MLLRKVFPHLVRLQFTQNSVALYRFVTVTAVKSGNFNKFCSDSMNFPALSLAS